MDMSFIVDAGCIISPAFCANSVSPRVNDVTNGKGVDHVAEVEFGTNLAIDIKVMAPGGSIAVYGSQQNMEPVVPVGQMWGKCLRVDFVLVYALPPERRRQALADIGTVLASNALVHRVARRYPLARIVDAHVEQESGRAVGNIVVEIG